MVITHSTFVNNTVRGTPYQPGAGGGLLISARYVEIGETTFHKNSAGHCGALIVQVVDIRIRNSHFVNNMAVFDSGGAICIFQ